MSILVVAGVAAVLLSLYALAFVLASYFRFPEPIRFARMVAANLTNSPAALPRLMPSHSVAAGGVAPAGFLEYAEQPEDIGTVNWKSKVVLADIFLEESQTRAFLVVRQGLITYEWYHPDYTEEYLFPVQSLSKSLTALVVGNLIEQGVLDEDSRLVAYVPEWATGDEFDDITIRHLLDMQAGVNVLEKYPEELMEYFAPLAQMYGTTDHEHFVHRHREMAFTPGSRTEYRSVDTQLLAMAVVKVTGDPLSDMFSEWYWQPLGAEYDAYWAVDRIGGTEKAFTGFVCAARDLARIGVLLANEGMVGERRLVSKAWVKRLATPVARENCGWGYAAQMWHPIDGVQLGLGAFGQQMYIDAASKDVLIKLAACPKNQTDEVREFDVLNQIARRTSPDR